MKLRHRKWRHHGLGMLQTEITPMLRIHVWHPWLMADWYIQDPFRKVHDHRFFIHSVVLVGELWNVDWGVHQFATGSFGSEATHGISSANTKSWTVSFQEKVDQGLNYGNGTPELLGPAFAFETGRQNIVAGECYEILRGCFHTTEVEDLCITLMHRSRRGEHPSRVLGEREGQNILARADAERVRETREEILALAEDRSSGIDL